MTSVIQLLTNLNIVISTILGRFYIQVSKGQSDDLRVWYRYGPNTLSIVRIGIWKVGRYDGARIRRQLPTTTRCT